MKHIKKITTTEEREIQSPDIVTMVWYDQVILEQGTYIIDGEEYSIGSLDCVNEPDMLGITGQQRHVGIRSKTTAVFYKK